jgi:hypothetical protein
MWQQMLLGFLIIFGLFSAQAQAETKRVKVWRVSAAILGAVTIADIQSSAGRMEANSMLQSNNGRFGGRGIALKSLMVGGALTGQWLMLRRNPNAATQAAAINFAVAGLTGVVVVRNHMLK